MSMVSLSSPHNTLECSYCFYTHFMHISDCTFLILLFFLYCRVVLFCEVYNYEFTIIIKCVLTGSSLGVDVPAKKTLQPTTGTGGLNLPPPKKKAPVKINLPSLPDVCTL